MPLSVLGTSLSRVRIWKNVEEGLWDHGTIAEEGLCPQEDMIEGKLN